MSDNSPKLIIKELENSQKILNDTLEQFNELGSLEKRLSKANNSLEDNSKGLTNLTSDLKSISQTLILLLDTFKELVTNFSHLDTANLSKIIKDSNDSYETKIKEIENKIMDLNSLKKEFDHFKIDYDKNNKKLLENSKTNVTNNRKNQETLNNIMTSINIIKDQTKKKGIFS